MSDFYTDFPYPEVVIKVPEPEQFCAVGDMVAGMKSGLGRVERFVDGGLLVHPTKAEDFSAGDVLVSPTAIAEISTVDNA